MASPNQSAGRSNSGLTKLLAVLVAAQFASIAGIFTPYVFAQPDRTGLRIFALIICGLALFTLASVWLDKPWAIWATLTLVSFKLTIDLFTWTVPLNHLLILLSVIINAAMILIAFTHMSPLGPSVTASKKVFFGCVLVLAAWVGYWGLFAPAQVDIALPFKVPPLHARFLGAMYLSGAIVLFLSMFARIWPEVRGFVPMISIWTGMLGIISVFHLAAFNWSRTQVWVWFFAYICFPIIAAWIAWRQRSQQEHAPGSPMSRAFRGYLYLQGGVDTLLGLSLLIAPTAMTALWPWKISPVLAHMYSAPFLSYGLGTLYAARQQTWPEVRLVVYLTLTFALLVLVGSSLHQQLFKFGTASAWLWFGGFGLAALILALFTSIPALRREK